MPKDSSLHQAAIKTLNYKIASIELHMKMFSVEPNSLTAKYLTQQRDSLESTVEFLMEDRRLEGLEGMHEGQ